MKIKLVIPPPISHPGELRQITQFKIFLPPYGAACLKSYLKGYGHEVSISDLNLRLPDFKARLISLSGVRMHKRITDYLINDTVDNQVDDISEIMARGVVDDNYSIIGFSVLSRLNLATALLVAKKIKALSKAPIVFGGSFMTECAEFKKFHTIQKFLENYKFIDFIIYGVGEIPLIKLSEYLNQCIQVKDVPNLIYRKDSKIMINERKLYDINDMPLPDFDGLPLKLYSQAGFFKKVHLPYSITRGCTEKCSFCNFYLVTPKVEIKSCQKIIDELTQLKDKYKVNNFFFCECRVNISYKYLEELCDIMISKKLNISWQTVCGINNVDYKLLVKMRKAGCYSLTWGIESGSNRMLKKMNKRFIAQDAGQVLKDAYSAGIANVVNFITGFIGEDDQDVAQTVSFIKENAKFIKAVRLFDFGLAPYTPLYEYPEKFGIENIFLDHYSAIGFGRIGYDEINGLKWASLIKKKQDTYNRVSLEIDAIFHRRIAVINFFIRIRLLIIKLFRFFY